MKLLYSIKVGIDLNPYLICLTSITELLDIKKLKIEKQYLNSPFLIELMLFNEEGDCVQYVREDSYSFKLIKDVEAMINQLLEGIKEESATA